MKRLGEEISHFFRDQGFVIVNTIDQDGSVHSSCKGIVRISGNGKVYLLDLYRGRTYNNLRHNPNVSITVVDEYKFMGYCLKGKAKMIPQEKLDSRVILAWEKRIADRLTRRVIKNIREEKGRSRHPEALLPKPQYLIVMDVDEIIDLTPHNIKKE
jgi:uncharacterized pyridoxamine 5'-phosphate oxidase family protein